MVPEISKDRWLCILPQSGEYMVLPMGNVYVMLLKYEGLNIVCVPSTQVKIDLYYL